jgi:peptide/nickel transport system substrate-binding protein
MKLKRNMGEITKSLLVIALALVTVFSLAACGSGGKTGSTIGTGSANGTDNGASQTDPDRELVIGVPGSIKSLDVNREAGILNYYLAAIVNEGLVSINNEGQVVPALAESWDDGGDASVWTFKLRADAKFSDGSSVTAEDIIWSIERAQNPKESPGVNSYFPDYIQSVEKTADDEITIKLEGSHAGFIWAVSNAGGLFVSQKAWGEAAKAIGSSEDLLLGSGPYKVTEFNPGSNATFEATGTWWGGETNIKKIRFDFIEDDATRLLAFTSGDIDFALNIPVEQSEQWEKVDGATVESIGDRSYYGLTFDETVKPFDDEHVRRAVSYAVDAKSIVDGSILKGHGQPATAVTPPEQFASVLSNDEANEKLAAITHYEFDIDKAKEELAQSGSPGGFETTITYPDSYQNTGKASLVIADSLKELGITLNVKEIPLEQWLDEIGDGNQGVGWMIYIPTTAEPGEIASWLFDAQGLYKDPTTGEESSTNPANWTNKEAAALAADILSAASLEAEVAPTLEANEIAQQQAIYAPVWWGQSAVAYSDIITVTDYNTYTLTSQNWPQQFAYK